MQLRRLPLVFFLAALPLAIATRTDAAPDGSDPAARGLDLFLHVPGAAAPSEPVPVQIEAFGFPAVTTLVPLAGASVEAVWNPEKLGPGVSQAPVPVRATTDAAGRAHLDVPVPAGDDRPLELLVGLRIGEHARTKSVTIHRKQPERLSLHLAERDVVPGSSVATWVTASHATTGQPLAKVPVQLDLLEGAVEQRSLRLLTDAAGVAVARIPIPRTEDPSIRWTLRAKMVGVSSTNAEASASLVQREETPATPQITADFAASEARAGDRVSYSARVRDAAGQPIASLAVRVWIGPKGTEPPSDQRAWEKVSTLVRTDRNGQIDGSTQVPATVAPAGTSLQLVVRAKVDGRDLQSSATVAVAMPQAKVELFPEAGSLVPGMEQRLFLRVRDGWDRPVSAAFTLEGDGLRGRIVTDAFGEGFVVYRPPVDVGALRNVGPCAGDVAAAITVRPEGEVSALGPRKGALQRCVVVDRDRTAMLRIEPSVVRAGDKVRVRVELGPPQGQRAAAPGRPGATAVAKDKRAWSLVAQSDEGEQSASAWIEDGEQGGEIELPQGARGVWSLSALSPRTDGTAYAAAANVLVTPRILPKLTVRITGGRAAPGGEMQVDAELTDGRGGGLAGTVAAVAIDKLGGGSTRELEQLDTRHTLCSLLSIEDKRCDRVLEGEAAFDPVRRANLSQFGTMPVLASSDPAGSAAEELKVAFGAVLRSLEGAVFEATESPDRLRDARRKEGTRWVFNPELFTLVTAAMDAPPLTPGGEPLVLADLSAIDRQVDFDHVARRVTRLKLFHILSAVRDFKREHGLDSEEPALRDPAAMLRRLTRDGTLTPQMLLDPWGGTIEFVKAAGPALPFLSVARGFELRAPGPDNRIGTADDVRDPFERVLRSGSPYANAVDEDRLVDAKLDMEVGDATVSAWQSTLEELTGTALGGSGYGRLGGSHTSRPPRVRMGATNVGSGSGRLSRGVSVPSPLWVPPTRTDAQGRVRLHVPLGDSETTYRIAFIGMPDGASPATAGLEVPVALPVSARVDGGAVWVERDQVDVAITLRNRTEKPVRAALSIAASGVAALARPAQAAPAVDVPAGGSAAATVRVRALRAGRATLDVHVDVPGLPGDRVHHEWDVEPAGERRAMFASRWVDGTQEIGLVTSEHAIRPLGAPRLVLERGFTPALGAALHSLDLSRVRTADALADALEVASRIRRWAIATQGERSLLSVQAADLTRRALGRLSAYSAPAADADLPWSVRARAWVFSPPELARALADPGDCPELGDGTRATQLDTLDVEPPPRAGVAKSCWDAFVTNAVTGILAAGSAADLARAVLALAERPHRAAQAANLAAHLRQRVSLAPSGAISLSGDAGDRATRAIVFAALLRSARLGTPSAASPERLAAWISAQQDQLGGYGSAKATRSVVRAILGSGLADPGPAKSIVTVTSGSMRREIELGPSARVVVPLEPHAGAARVDVLGPGVLARFEQTVLRSWSHPPADSGGALALDVKWPAHPRAGHTGRLQVTWRHTFGRPVQVDTRVPLPPGVSLAEPITGARQVQGVLWIRRALDESSLPVLIELPLRFGLAGLVTAPEARARLVVEETEEAIAPARAVQVQ